MLEFLKAKDDFVGQLLRHLGTSAIMDLLLRLISCIEATDTRTACITVCHCTFPLFLRQDSECSRVPVRDCITVWEYRG